jgi:hypothetical protein
MNSVQLHLALTHVPVILSLVGLIILVLASVKKNNSLIKTAYLIILIAGLSSLPVYFSGEGAEEAVEKLPGVSESIIEKHEDVAKLAMLSIAGAGLLALAAIFLNRLKSAGKIFRLLILAVSLLAGGLMVQTAHLGGLVRHSEIRSEITQQKGDEVNEKGLQKQSEDD